MSESPSIVSEVLTSRCARECDWAHKLWCTPRRRVAVAARGEVDVEPLSAGVMPPRVGDDVAMPMELMPSMMMSVQLYTLAM